MVVGRNEVRLPALKGPQARAEEAAEGLNSIVQGVGGVVSLANSLLYVTSSWSPGCSPGQNQLSEPAC